MASVYDTDGFQARVNFAASVILSGRDTTRNFDTCFEMLDGDYVIEAIRRRGVNNPKLAEAFPRYICRESIAEMEKRFKHLSRKELVAEAKAMRHKFAVKLGLEDANGNRTYGGSAAVRP